MDFTTRMINKARGMARRSVQVNYKVGAVIAKGSYIIANGRNRNFCNGDKRYPGYRGVHAEIDAIYKRRALLAGATIYVVVLTINGHDAVSRPCDKCYPILKDMGIKEIVYSKRGEIVREKVT